MSGTTDSSSGGAGDPSLTDRADAAARECVALLRRLTRDIPLASNEVPTAEEAAQFRHALREYMRCMREQNMRPEQALVLLKGVIADALPRSTENYPRLAEAVITWAIQEYFAPQ